MILRRLRLNPFGCFADREVAFEPGLNVVLGPNEAGKSTLFHAARSALLRTTLDKREFAKYIARFLPAAGGDTVRVEMDFEAEQGLYRLRRRWGPARGSELTLPGGEVLTDDEAVRSRLESVLPARHGALWKILFTSQTELAAAVGTLKEEAQDAIADLADVLRRGMLQTAGVSPDRFRALLEDRIEGAFGNWDAERGSPRNNRGMENPWRKNVGEILQAYYEKEGLSRSLKLAEEIERKVDEANRSLRDVAEAQERTRRFLEEHRTAYGDARRRGTLEASLQAVRAEQQELTRLATEWPVASSEAQKLAASISVLEKRLEPLRAERAEVTRETEHAALRERLGRVSRLTQRLAEAEAARQGPRLGRDEIAELRTAQAAVGGAAATVEGGRLSVTVTAPETCELQVVRDSGPAESISLTAGEGRNVEAAGRLRIRHPRLELDIRSGDARSGPALEAARSRLSALLAARGLSGLPEAEELHRRTEGLEAEAQAARRSLEEELAGEPIEALRARGEAIGPPRVLRALAAVVEELTRVEADLGSARRELAEKQERIKGWEGVHGTTASLIDALAVKKSAEKEIETGLAAATPLPEGYAGAADFVEAYEKARETHAQLTEKHGDIRAAKAALEGRMPEESAEELRERLEQAARRFRDRVEHGAALQRVQAETARLLASSDTAVYAGMTQELGRLMGVMTAGRYDAVEMEGALPVGLASGGGPTLGWERLSAGTRDLLALALRLAMASHLLGTARGMAVLDDPLVEMDPERQEAAAAVLRAFADERQLIVLTCHPAHAEMLGGRCVRL